MKTKRKKKKTTSGKKQSLSKTELAFLLACNAIKSKYQSHV